jgi:hypothetical protein
MGTGNRPKPGREPVDFEADNGCVRTSLLFVLPVFFLSRAVTIPSLVDIAEAAGYSKLLGAV